MPPNIASHLQNIFALSEYLRDNVYVSETHRTLTLKSYGTSDESSVSHVQLHTLTDEFHVFTFRDSSALRLTKASSEDLVVLQQRTVWF
jgi:hypothetical protein